jgi:hypothetical protein
VDKDIVGGSFVPAIVALERTLMGVDGFESPSRIVRSMQFVLMLLLDDVAELIVCDDFVELAVGHFNEEFDMLMVSSIVVHDFACNGSSEFASVVGVSDECETKKFVRTEMRQFKIRRIDIEAGKVGGREENGIRRLPITRRYTEIRIVGVIPFANGGPSNYLLCIVGEDLIGEGITFGFRNSNPATRFLTTLGRKGMVFVGVENLFVPVEVQKG